MDVETEVKPWISLEEWKKVKNCLMQRKLKLAQEYINVWKIRTHKLDAGKPLSKTVNFCQIVFRTVDGKEICGSIIFVEFKRLLLSLK